MISPENERDFRKDPSRRKLSRSKPEGHEMHVPLLRGCRSWSDLNGTHEKGIG